MPRMEKRKRGEVATTRRKTRDRDSGRERDRKRGRGGGSEERARAARRGSDDDDDDDDDGPAFETRSSTRTPPRAASGSLTTAVDLVHRALDPLRPFDLYLARVPARAAASPAPQANTPTKKRKRAKQPSGLAELLEAKKKREQGERAASGLGPAGFLQGP